MNNEFDNYWMRIAFSIANKSMGRTNENPPVGCVIVSKENKLISVGNTKNGGRPHAEDVAIKNSKVDLNGSTIYVTLEPCLHYGKTSPCIKKIIKSGIKRIVYAIDDPDPRVNGKTFKFAKKNNVEIKKNVNKDYAKNFYSGFFNRIIRKKPFVISKISTSIEGFISSKERKKIWFSNYLSKLFVHDLRSRCDAILTGVDTINIDNSELNCRYPFNDGDTPLRIILDSNLKINLNSKIIKNSKFYNTIVYCKENLDSLKKNFLLDNNIKIIEVPYNNKLCEKTILYDLGARGINTLLIESGAKINSNFRKLNFIDKLIWILTPMNLENGVNPFLKKISSSSDLIINLKNDFDLISEKYLDNDKILIWQKK